MLMAAGGPAMPAFISAGAGTSAAPPGATMSPAFPASIVAGDLLILHAAMSDTVGGTVTTPAGWTSIGAFPGGAQVTKQWAFFKIADGSESGTLAVTCSADTAGGMRIYRFSSGTGAEAAAGTRTAASSTSMPAQNLTTLGNNRLAVQLFAAWTNTTIGDITGESGTDYTEAVAEFASATGPILMSVQTGQVPTPTAITGGTATLGAASVQRDSYGFAIIP